MREYSVLVSKRHSKLSFEDDLTFTVIFKDPEDLIWSTYLDDVADRLTAMEIAVAMNEARANHV